MSAVYNDTQSAAMQQLCERSVKEQFRIGKAHAEQLGVRLDSLLSLRSSIFARHVRQTAGSHRSRSREYAQRFADGEAIPAMASRANFSPYLLARIILEETLGLSKKAVSALAKDWSRIEDERLRAEVIECCETDRDFSPYLDRVRRAVGHEYEYLLQRKLSNRRLPFEDEDDLRTQGHAKTPDVALIVPIAIRLRRQDGPDSFHIVHWIDSKAMYGDDFTYEVEHLEQLMSYVSRYGPGAVIYWFGCPERLQRANPEILVLGEFPADQDIVLPA